MDGSVHTGRRLLAALTDLRTAVADLRLPLSVAGADESRALAARMVDQLDDHLLPRVRQLGAPLLAVVGGSTGAGKSTLVNSLVGAPVSASGVIRPTTRAPVLIHHPDEQVWFTGDRILPRLARATGASDDWALRLVAHPGISRGLALVDAPDIDSVVVENRRMGEELLGAADLWVFVTTAARYADAVPWDLLTEAARRRAVVVVVLNRVEPAARDAVTAHLEQMVAEHDLEAQVAVVLEAQVDDGLLPASAVAELDGWLRAIVSDTTARELVVQRTVRGAMDDLLAAAPTLAAAVDGQRRSADALRETVRRAYQVAREDVDAATADGTLLRGEVLARWQDFVGTGEVLRALEERVGSWRDRLSAAVRGRPAPERVAHAVGRELVDLVVDAADRAAARAHEAWYADPAGAELATDLRLTRASADLPDRVAAEVRAWQGGVLDLVSTEGVDRRGAARALSFGVNGLGAALMITIFASTGGLTAAELGVAGGTAVLAQRLLEAVFGDDAVRRLTRAAHQDLQTRIGVLLDDEAARFRSALDAADVRPEAADRIRSAVATLSVVAVEMGSPPAAGPIVPTIRPAAGEPARADGGPWRRLWHRLTRR